MSSTLTLKSSEVSLNADQNPRARERSRLPQERRFYQVNALPNLLLSPQHKPPEFAQLDSNKHVEVTTAPQTLWKRLSAPGTFSRRSSWSSTEVLSVSKQNAIPNPPNWEEKRQKASGLGERIKHILSHKPSVKGQPDHTFRPPTPGAEHEAEAEPEIQPGQRQARSLETQIAEFGSTPFRMTPMNDFELLTVSVSPTDSTHSSLPEIRPSTTLFNLTAGLDDPDSRPATATSIPLLEGRTSAPEPLPHCPTSPNFCTKDSASTVRQLESYRPESRPTSPFNAHVSEEALLDSIVDFFESFGAGFCWTTLEEDTFGIRSPADFNPSEKPSVFRQQVAAVPA